MEYLRKKMTINIKFQIFLFLFCLICLFLIYFKFGLTLSEISVFLGLGTLLSINILIYFSYRVGWDGQHLAYRDWGLRSLIGNKEIRINAMDLTSLEGRYDGDTSMKRAFYEFDYIDVRAKGMRGKKIWLHPMSLDEFRLKLVLGDIYRLKPGIFSHNVLDYMNYDRDM